MKKKPNSRELFALIKKAIPFSFRTGPALAAVGAFLFTLAVVLANINSNRGGAGDLEDFEAGKVADRDVTADQAVTYEDKEATRLRQEAQERQVPAVFHFSGKASEEIRNNWKRFAVLAASRADGGLSREQYMQLIHDEFPGTFTAEALDTLYNAPDLQEILDQAELVLNAVLEKGIFSIPQTGLDKLNRDVVELIRQQNSRIERERIAYAAIITRDKTGEAVERQIAAGSFSAAFVSAVPALLLPFISENVFYSPEETVQRLIETKSKTEPVIKYIERGKRVIKKGFIITEEEMMELRALNLSLPGNDVRNILSQILLLFLIFMFLAFYCNRKIQGRSLTNSEAYLICALSALYILGAVLARNLPFGSDYIVSSLVIPTALVVMLPAILIGPRLALVLGMVLPLGAFFTGSYDTPSYVFALVSGVAASFVLQGAQKRMDLIRAGLIIAAANCVAMIALLLGQRAAAGAYPGVLFWAAFNGLASGMLVLGFLPPLEHALNAATAFRLIELSDLNAPILRRLFTAAPGTYSHSIMVANLAEAACQDIGANALLARVGAYYHDLGKMENPEYFVENQTDYNRHDDIAPRLSATVIRSHVKFGLEKARQLGLPREVIDIIGEHHGNSVITWFYNKALKQEGADGKSPVNMEDFTYPGTPPRSRESAVVMLADMSEAAVRTLDKPTVARLEKFIQELINAKVEHGQLARSELTFKDLETIKNAFVRVLVGYYHSRIEYPNQGAGK
ncbi:MAG: HDIG domain-containing protein [Treponema sp.]|jgi:putative nucleotidyltransferase with HDIG domain|nr:HDIG domain-containing protein [Treponema sp.]